MSNKMKWRYVEVTYDTPEQKTHFFATVGESENPNVALETARIMCAERHKDATNIEEFMQRIITPAKAEKIREQMDAGTWEGWNFERENAA